MRRMFVDGVTAATHRVETRNLNDPACLESGVFEPLEEETADYAARQRQARVVVCEGK